jgi:DNA primase small subunit
MTGGTALIEVPTHPTLLRAKSIIETDFISIMMEEQNILADQKQREKLLNMVQNRATKETLEQNWGENTNYSDPENSVKLWKLFRKIIKNEKPVKSQVKVKEFDMVASAMFTFLYPRLDINVSKGINHLLKSPFCVHPKTGKVCVPFDPQKVDEFNPCECPTLSQSLNEYDELVKTREAGTPSSISTVPCLKESMKVFNTFLKGLKAEYTQTVVKQKRQETQKIDQMEVDNAF